MKKKNIKETTRPRITGDFIGGGAPRKLARRNIASLSGYSGGQTMPADTGGTFMNRLYPDNYFDYLEQDEFEKEEENLVNESVASNLFQTSLFAVPKYGDFLALLRCLYVIFMPITGLNAKSKRFTKKLNNYAKISLGDDFLEPEGSMQDEDELDESIDLVLKVLSNPDQYDTRESVDSLRSVISSYNDLLSQEQQAFICTLGAADFFYKQNNVFVSAGISVVKPEQIANFALDKYASMFVNDIKQHTDLDDDEEKSELIKKVENIADTAGDAMYEFISSMSQAIDKIPLVGGAIRNISSLFKKAMSFGDSLGHIDLLYNKRKLARLAKINDALRLAKKQLKLKVGTAVRSARDQGETTSIVGATKDQPRDMSLKSIIDWLIKFLFENGHAKTDTSLQLIMEEYLNKIDDIDLEEEEEVEEASSGGVGGFALPIGMTPKKKADGKHVRTYEMEIKEQIEYIRKLQAYHQKTTNRLK